MLKKLIKHNNNLQKTIKTQTEMIDFLFKRLEDWNELVKDTQSYLDEINKYNSKYLTYCSVLLITNIITITFFIIYIIGRN